MVRSQALALLVALAALSCGGGAGTPDAATPTITAPGGGGPSPSPTFGNGHAILDNGSEPVLIDVEVAGTPEQRMVGLMFRRSLPEDEGMVFLFFEETTGGFHMENTLIPLSIAFFDKDGEILEIFDMDPCREDPCPSYFPDVGYYGALEVNQGAFGQWDISEGDFVRMNQ